jgi:hypothetical protein
MLRRRRRARGSDQRSAIRDQFSEIKTATNHSAKFVTTMNSLGVWIQDFSGYWVLDRESWVDLEM